MPAEVMHMVARIGEVVGKYFPAAYSADFMNSPKGFVLVELNSRPGLQHSSWSASYKKFNDAIVRMLVDAVKVAPARA